MIYALKVLIKLTRLQLMSNDDVSFCAERDERAFTGSGNAHDGNIDIFSAIKQLVMYSRVLDEQKYPFLEEPPSIDNRPDPFLLDDD